MSEDSDSEFERFLLEADDSLSPEPSTRKVKPGGTYTQSSASASAVAAAATALRVSPKLSNNRKSKCKSETTNSTKRKSSIKFSNTQLSDSEEELPSYYDDNSTRRGSGRENSNADPYAFDLTSLAFSITARENTESENEDEAKKKIKMKQLKNLAVKAVAKSVPISMDDRIAEILKRTGSTQFQTNKKSDDDEYSDKESDEEIADEISPNLHQSRQENDKNDNEGSDSDAERSSLSNSLGMISANFSVRLPKKPNPDQSRLSLSSLDSEQFAVNRDALNSDLEVTPSRYEQQEITFLKSEPDKDRVLKEDEARVSQVHLSESDTFGYGDEDFEESERSNPEGVSTKTEDMADSAAQDDVQVTQDVEYSDDNHGDAYSSAQDATQAAHDSDDYKDKANSPTQDDTQVKQNADYSDDYQDDVFEAEPEVKIRALSTASLEPDQAVKKDVQDSILPLGEDTFAATNSKIDALLANYGIFNTQSDNEKAGAKLPSHELKPETQDASDHSSGDSSLAGNVVTLHATTITTAKEISGVVNSPSSSPPPPPPPADDNEEDDQELQKFSLYAPVFDPKNSKAQPPVQQSVSALEKNCKPLSAVNKFLQIESQVAALRFVSPDTHSLESAISPTSGRVHPIASKFGDFRDAASFGPPPPVFEPMSLSFNTDFVAENEETQREIDEFVRTSFIVRQEKREAAHRSSTAKENELVLRLQQAQRQILQLKECMQKTTASDMSIKVIASDAVAENEKMHNLTRPSQSALEKLRKEIKTQDNLIAAFQKENERLMQQLKQVRQDVHYNVHETNEVLRRQIKELQEQLGEVATLGGGSDLTSKAQYRVAVEARLEAEAHVLALQEELAGLRLIHQQKLNELTLELDRVKKAKIELECRYEGVDLTQVAQEAQHVSELQKELDFIKKEHVHALAALQKKLDWYVENQRLLDGQDDELRQLRHQVAAQSSEPAASVDIKAGGPSPARSHRRSPMDIKRIQELESRLAEVEEAMRRRHPDSLANLILATRRANENSKTRALEREYQDKIVALSRELEQAHERNETKLASFRQQQEKLLLQYKRKMKEQEKQLKQLSKAPIAHRLMSKDTARASTSSDAELAKIRRFYADKIKELERKWEAKYRSLRNQQFSGLKSNQQVRGLTYVDSSVVIANLQRQIREQELILKQERAKVKQLEAESRLGCPSLNGSFGTKDTMSKQNFQDQIADLKAQLENSENARARLAHTLTSVQTLSLARSLNFAPDQPQTVTKSSPKMELEEELAHLRQDLESLREARNSEQATATQKIDRLETQLAEYTKRSTSLEAQLADAQREVQRHQMLLFQADQHNQSLTAQAQRIPNLEEEVLDLRRELELPRTPSMVQYRSLELKVATLEQKYKLREAELKVVLDRALTSTHLEQLSRERAHRAAIATKNDEIAIFKRQLEEILDELAQLQQPAAIPLPSVSSKPLIE